MMGFSRIRIPAPGRVAALVAAVVTLASGPVTVPAVAGLSRVASSPAADAGPTGAGETAPPDSAAIEAAARSAQATFEQKRRRRLPIRRSEYGPCDEHVGRFCHWFEDRNVDPRPEPASIARLRLGLLARLDSAFARLPGSRWLSGQLVHYRIEAGRAAAALAAARACRVPGAWCERLEGLSLHALGRDSAAEIAFAGAERDVDPAARCRRDDLSTLLEGDAAADYAGLPCPGPAHEVFERRFWWLADPLYLVPGNERLVEDRARRLTSELEADAATPYDLRWGPDLEELTLRYGWPAWWERVPADPLRPGDVDSWIAHDPPHALSFLPRVDPLTPPAHVGPDGWRLDDPRPRSTYATAYADTFVRLRNRPIVFRRGDSVLVLAAYDLGPPDGASGSPIRAPRPPGTAGPAGARDDDVAALLLLAGGPGDAYGRDRRDPASRSGVLMARAPARGLLVAVEALDRRRRVAARSRRGLDLRPPPPDVPAISGLLAGPPFAGAEGAGASGRLPVTTADPEAEAARLRLAGPGPQAAPSALPGQAVELYWETYGLRAGGPLYHVEVTLREADAASFDPVHPRPPSPSRPRVRLAWSEEPRWRGPADPHRVALALPRSLRNGLYAVEVRLTVPGWTPLEARAPLVVRAGVARHDTDRLHL